MSKKDHTVTDGVDCWQRARPKQQPSQPTTTNVEDSPMYPTTQHQPAHGSTTTVATPVEVTHLRQMVGGTVSSSSAYDLSFFDGEQDYETFGEGRPSVYTQSLPPAPHDAATPTYNGRHQPDQASVLCDLRRYLSATVFRRSSYNSNNTRRNDDFYRRGEETRGGGGEVPLTDAQFNEEFPYERLLELDDALRTGGGLSLREIELCLVVEKEGRGTATAMCPICLDPLHHTAGSRDSTTTASAVQVVGCLHRFHRTCLEEWFICHRTCPLCRQDPTRTTQTT